MTETELAESIAADLVTAGLIRVGDQSELSTELAKGEVDSSEWARLLVAREVTEQYPSVEGGSE